ADNRVCIDEISSAITRQKEILRALEQDKSDVRRDLNSIFDPMARVPLEISSNIFMRCLPMHQGPDSTTAPMVFLAVSNLWSNIALSTPSLWTTMRIQSPRAETFDELLVTWIQRARGLPMSVFVTRSLDERIQLSIKEHAPRLGNLRVSIETDLDLEHMGMATFSSLKTLLIDGAPMRRLDNLHLKTCLDVLQAAPGLVECDLINIDYERTYGSPPQPMTHSSLQHLRLGRPDYKFSEDSSSAGILPRLTLPALQTLIISNFDIAPEESISFLGRSSPPLLSLGMDTRTEGGRSLNLDACLRLVPGLADLHLSCSNADNSLKAILAPGQRVLPNLRSVTVCENGSFTDYETLVQPPLSF
ncbi:hypothetical protein FB451DRAFT_1513555, partial [Mycena latifolia]